MQVRGKGCSPDIASRIVGLLMADVGIGCVYTPSPAAPPAAQQQQVEQPKPKAPRARKVTPEVSAYIRNAHGTPIPEILDQVHQLYGVQLSSGSVYKEWQSAHLARAQATPTTQAGPSDTSDTEKLSSKFVAKTIDKARTFIP